MKYLCAAAIIAGTCAFAAPGFAEPVLTNDAAAQTHAGDPNSGNSALDNARQSAADTGQSGDNNTTLNAKIGNGMSKKHHHKATASASGSTDTQTHY